MAFMETYAHINSQSYKAVFRNITGQLKTTRLRQTCS